MQNEKRVFFRVFFQGRAGYRTDLVLVDMHGLVQFPERLLQRDCGWVKFV